MVPHCDAYRGPAQCSSCESGFTLSYEDTRCIQNTASDDNCQAFSNIQCKQCPTNYHMLNDYLRVGLQKNIESFILDSKENQNLLMHQTQLKVSQHQVLENSVKVFDSCILNDVANCQVFSSFDVCS